MNIHECYLYEDNVKAMIRKIVFNERCWEHFSGYKTAGTVIDFT